MALTLEAKLARFSPIVCRLLARKKTPTGGIAAMTDDDIVRASGLCTADVKHLSWLHSWDNVEVGKMLAFTRGCGLNLDDRQCIHKARQLFNTGTGSYLKRSPLWESLFKPLTTEWLAKNSKR